MAGKSFYGKYKDWRVSLSLLLSLVWFLKSLQERLPQNFVRFSWLYSYPHQVPSRTAHHFHPYSASSFTLNHFTLICDEPGNLIIRLPGRWEWVNGRRPKASPGKPQDQCLRDQGRLCLLPAHWQVLENTENGTPQGSFLTIIVYVPLGTNIIWYRYE